MLSNTGKIPGVMNAIMALTAKAAWYLLFLRIAI